MKKTRVRFEFFLLLLFLTFPLFIGFSRYNSKLYDSDQINIENNLQNDAKLDGNKQEYETNTLPESASLDSTIYYNLEDSEAIYTGSQYYEDRAGTSLTIIGDFNNDDYDDIAIGSPHSYSSSGHVNIIYGSANPSGTTDLFYPEYGVNIKIIGEEQYDYFGSSMSAVGDVNGDGYDDLVVGAYNERSEGYLTGAAYLFYGKANYYSSVNLGPGAYGAKFIGEASGYGAGWEVKGVGDVNDDGFNDFIIGTSASSTKAYLIYGSNSLSGDISLADANVTITSSTSSLQKVAVGGMGDFNGDDIDDFILGCSSHLEGKSYLFLGKDDFDSTLDLSDADMNITGEYYGDGAGKSVDIVGDINGDGYDDLMIGANGLNESSGGAYVIFGTYSPLPGTYDLEDSDVIFTGERSGDEIGTLVGKIGDLDGDGYDEILISSESADYGTLEDCGLGYIIRGAPHLSGKIPLAHADVQLFGEDGSKSFSAVSGDGDVNDDGKVDLLVGARLSDLNGEDSGAVYLILNTELGHQLDGIYYLRYEADAFEGSENQQKVGKSISSAGDFNGDGYDDMLIGASGDDEGGSNAGATFLIYGRENSTWDYLSIENADLKFIGETSDDLSGSSVAGVGDVNQDGYDDILIGAWGYQHLTSTYAGRVYLILGTDSLSGDVDLSNADATFYSTNSMDWAGFSVAGAGDVNADGYDDMLIGAPGEDTGGSSAGATYVIYGFSSLSRYKNLEDANITITGEVAGDSSGFSVAGAGDVNADGYDDILIGAYCYDENNGIAYLILGGSSLSSSYALGTDDDAQFYSENHNDYAGFSVAGAGDVNDDGYDDMLIGAPGYDSDTGCAFLINGLASISDRILSEADIKFIGEDEDDEFGTAVAGTGDVNNDGVADILIGAPSANDNGTVYLFYGSGYDLSGEISNSHADAIYIGQSPSSYTGESVSSAGDIDGDGRDDFLIGAREFNSHGKVYLINGLSSVLNSYGTSDLGLSDATFNGMTLSEHSGRSVAMVGDINNDGYDDMLIGAYDYDNGIDNEAGCAFLVYGSWNFTGEYDLGNADAIFMGEAAGDQAGYSVVGAGNVNGDAYDDLLIGARYYNDGATADVGRVYLIYGSNTLSGTISLTDADVIYTGVSSLDYAGYSVSGVGNLNGDVYDDFIIGAPGASAGVSYIIYGSNSLSSIMLSSANVIIAGEISGDYAGCSVVGAGNVNGDAYDDVLIGALNFDNGATSNTGRAYLLYGSNSLSSSISLSTDADAIFTGKYAGDFGGCAVASAGDVNNDTRDDFLIGQYGYDQGGVLGSNLGAATLFFGASYSGSISLSSGDGFFIGSNGDRFGSSLAGVGDINNDSYDDFMIGAYYHSEGYLDREGAAYLFYGHEDIDQIHDTSMADAAFLGEEANDYAGRSISGNGDVNNDGFPDILIGADEGGITTAAGKAYLICGGGNNLPRAVDVELTPSIPYTTDDLIASFEYFDFEDHPIAHTEIKWYEDDVYQPTYDDLDVLPSSATEKNKDWYFTVQYADIFGMGPIFKSNTITINNTQPKMLNIHIKNPYPTEIDDLWPDGTLYDPDGENIGASAIYTWYKDGVQDYVGKSLSSIRTAAGQKWHFTVYLVDSDGWEFLGVSENVTILSNPAPTVNYCVVDSFEATTGPICVYYNISDPETNGTYSLTSPSLVSPVVDNKPWINVTSPLGITNYQQTIDTGITEELGMHFFTFNASDEDGGWSLTEFNITVFNLAPQISDTDSFSYQVEATGNTITWTPTDNSNKTTSYNVYRDGVQIISGSSWKTSQDIVLSSTYVDGLLPGDHNFTIIIYDGFGGTNRDEVIVKVTNPNPTITHPSDISFTEGTTGKSISWTVTDATVNGATYSITKNGLEHAYSTSWTSATPITLDVSDLGVGTYTYCITAEDGYGGYVQDEMIVTVTEASTTDDSTDTTSSPTNDDGGSTGGDDGTPDDDDDDGSGDDNGSGDSGSSEFPVFSLIIGIVIASAAVIAIVIFKVIKKPT